MLLLLPAFAVSTKLSNFYDKSLIASVSCIFVRIPLSSAIFLDKSINDKKEKNYDTYSFWSYELLSYVAFICITLYMPWLCSDERLVDSSQAYAGMTQQLRAFSFTQTELCPNNMQTTPVFGWARTAISRLWLIFSQSNSTMRLWQKRPQAQKYGCDTVQLPLLFVIFKHTKK